MGKVRLKNPKLVELEMFLMHKNINDLQNTYQGRDAPGKYSGEASYYDEVSMLEDESKIIDEISLLDNELKYPEDFGG